MINTLIPYLRKHPYKLEQVPFEMLPTVNDFKEVVDQKHKQELLEMRSNTTEFFGGSVPLSSTVTEVPKSSLTFNDQGVRNIAKMVFKGMQSA